MDGKNDAGLRVLVACACVAIIVAVGYYLIGEYRTHQGEHEAATQRALADVLRKGCLEDLASAGSTYDPHPKAVANCLSMGALTDAEVQAREDLIGVKLR
ncbi:hypothetical protein [Mesorhizobium sp. WSM4887]|uniref:hypothetical protein n=1 Tax=Mesorhizobium sp. WSM4887 TaxID=3038543 RepID=UPI002417AC3D|nr:hypothetical protein [Mesorhizobium sp. WSM4887]MDG4890925.1 hypothetical protein [Mesorhizobium sp. WSM4887]